MAHLVSRLMENKYDPGPIVDWILFFNYQFMRRMRWERDMRSRLSDWNKHWRILVDSGVLTTDEERPSNAVSIHHRSCSELVRESRNLRVSVAEFEPAHAIFRSHKRGSIKSADAMAQVKAEEQHRKKLKHAADELSRRDALIRRFIANTAVFRLFVEKAERQDVLLTWILQQLPLVAQEYLNGNVTFHGAQSPHTSALCGHSQTWSKSAVWM
jgi:hypothetical protein